LLIKYIKSVLWRVAKCLSYIEDARCLKVNINRNNRCGQRQKQSVFTELQPGSLFDEVSHEANSSTERQIKLYLTELGKFL